MFQNENRNSPCDRLLGSGVDFFAIASAVQTAARELLLPTAMGLERCPLRPEAGAAAMWVGVLFAGSCLLLVGCQGLVDDVPTDPGGGLNPGSNPGVAPGDDRPAVAPGTALDCRDTVYDPGDAVVARLTRTEYLRTIDQLFGVDLGPLASDIPYEVRAPRSTTSVSQTIDAQHLQAYGAAAAHVANGLGAFATNYTSCTELRTECETEFIQRLGRHVFRRPLRDEEVSGYAGIFTAVREEGDVFDVAASLTLRSMLISPQFLFHVEDERGNGVRRIDAYGLANRISYLVWNSPPDAQLLTAAEAGGLDTREGVEAETRRLLADTRAQRASFELFEDWLDLTRLERAVSGVDESTKEAMRAETEAFVQAVFWEDRGGLLDLVTADYTWGPPEVATLYGVPSEGAGIARYDLSGVPERRGVLTHGSVLAAHGNGNRPSIVSRGLFLLDALLCRGIPDPPAGVDTSATALPETASERVKSEERLENGTCGACHERFDPLAYAFEAYDGSGAYGTSDLHGNAVRSDGWIPSEFGSFEPGDPRGVEIPYEDLDGLIDGLASSPVVRSCLTENVLLYALRRAINDETEADACTIREVTGDATTAGGSYVEMMVALATHEMFAAVRSRQ